MRLAFHERPRWVCSTPLGVPVEPEVKSTTAMSLPRIADRARRHGWAVEEREQGLWVRDARRGRGRRAPGDRAGRAHWRALGDRMNGAPAPPPRRCASRRDRAVREQGRWAAARPLRRPAAPPGEPGLPPPRPRWTPRRRGRGAPRRPPARRRGCCRAASRSGTCQGPPSSAIAPGVAGHPRRAQRSRPAHASNRTRVPH